MNRSLSARLPFVVITQQIYLSQYLLNSYTRFSGRQAQITTLLTINICFSVCFFAQIKTKIQPFIKAKKSSEWEMFKNKSNGEEAIWSENCNSVAGALGSSIVFRECMTWNISPAHDALCEQKQLDSRRSRAEIYGEHVSELSAVNVIFFSVFFAFHLCTGGFLLS